MSFPIVLTTSILVLSAVALSAFSAWDWRADVLFQPPAASHIKYSTITGYFLQDDPSTDSASFDYTTSNLGLINRPYDTDANFDPHHTKTQWQRFEHVVFQLNAKSSPEVQYKVFFLGRHGEGYHNCYYSILPGNNITTWADAHLTPTGITQALTAASFWRSALETQHIPLTQAYFVSPLTRALQTANYTFGSLQLPASRPFAPLITEQFRETISIHTCDRRRSAASIAAAFPTFRIEAGFADADPLWRGDVGEGLDAERQRLRRALDGVFGGVPKETAWVSVTSHSGAIAAALHVLGHRAWELSTGAVVPVLVRAERVVGRRMESPGGWEGLNTCGGTTTRVVASSAIGGCVCAEATATATPDAIVTTWGA